MKTYKTTHILHSKVMHVLLLAITCLLYSCQPEDDVNDIFIGKTWYMQNVIADGKNKASDTQAMHQNGNNAYYIVFSAGTFQGCLSPGCTFSGKWAANGKDQSLSLRLTSEPSCANECDKLVVQILKNVRSYAGDIHVLSVKESDDNVLYLNVQRNNYTN